jgi:hypothetical protein
MAKGRWKNGALNIGCMPHGENHHLAKLTLAEVLEIRKLYKSGEFGYTKLSMLFNTTRANCRQIVKGRTWAAYA